MTQEPVDRLRARLEVEDPGHDAGIRFEIELKGDGASLTALGPPIRGRADNGTVEVRSWVASTPGEAWCWIRGVAAGAGLVVNALGQPSQ